MAQTAAQERVRRAWLRHPVVAFVRHKKVFAFYQQLYALIRAGTPLPTAFEQLVSYAPDARMQASMQEVALDIRNGATLGTALRKKDSLFDDTTLELVAGAEEAGRLEPVLGRLISFLEQVQRQRWQAVLGALWPAYLVAAMVFVSPLLSIAPALSGGGSAGAAYFKSFGINLSLVALSLGVLFGIPLGAAYFDKLGSLDRFVRSVPMLAAPRRQLAASRFVFALNLAIASGLEVNRTLRLAARSAASPAVLERLPHGELLLRRGASLTEGIRALDVLDPSTLGTVAVAEQTGTYDASLERLALELQETALRSSRFLVMLVTGLVAVAVLGRLVFSILGALLGPIRTFYDLVGTG